MNVKKNDKKSEKINFKELNKYLDNHININMQRGEHYPSTGYIKCPAGARANSQDTQWFGECGKTQYP